MKVIVKTLKGQIINIEIESNTTILDIKTKLNELKGFEIEGQKLIFKGRHTQDESQMQTLGVKEKDHFVVMVSKAKIQEKEEKKEQSEKEQEKKEHKVETKTQNKKQKVVTSKKQVDVEYENKVTQITNMGFDRQTAIASLTAAYNDVDRAVEYCVSGVPLVSGNEDNNQQSQMQVEESFPESQFNAIVNSPALAEIREAVISNKSSLPQLITRLAATHPEIYTLVNEHREDLMQYLISGDLENESAMMEEQISHEEIPISEEDNQAINRLAALGFDKSEAAQAYLACCKNEEIAANLLFERQANGEYDNSQNQGDEFY